MGLGLRTTARRYEDAGAGAGPAARAGRGGLAAKARLSKDIERGKVVPQGIADTDPQRSGP